MYEIMIGQSPKSTAGEVIFLGEVTGTELITPAELTAAIGFSSGTAFNTTEPWLKWSIDGKIVLYAKKPYRYNVSWAQLEAINAVYGTRTLDIKGKTYTIGLPKGVNPNPLVPSGNGYDPAYSHNSEWNRLMYIITVATVNNPKPSQVGPNQANYTDLQLGLITENGRNNWCQETDSGDPTTRVYRGSLGVSYLSRTLSTSVGNARGWRPRLELVQS